MPSDFREISNNSIVDAKNVHHKLIEKALEMRCISYLAQIKAQLLTNTIYEMDNSKKALTTINSQLQQEISERKRIEAKLTKARNEAEEATKLKDKFVALVTHDLNNPLHVVYGSLQLLKMSNEFSGESGQLIEHSLTACKQMSSLINDILSMNRIKDGKFVPKRTMVEIDAIIDSVVKNHQLIADEKGIQIKNQITDKTNIYADEKLINEVISNLLSNAIKFCRKGDSIRIHSEDDEYYSIIFSDTGVGIEPEFIDNLFRFEQKTSTSGTAGEQGSGLGLPLAHDIIAAHGGELRVESVMGEGTNFRIKLPKTTEEVSDDEVHS